jgi:uncharacterized protein DUF4242
MGFNKRNWIVSAALAATMILGGSAFAQDTVKEAKAAKVPASKPGMHTFVIEREIPNAGNLSKKELHDISVKSNGVLKDLGPDIKWVDSFVTQDKVYCIYQAKNEEIIKEHAKRGGFPANKISEVKTVISPATGK